MAETTNLTKGEIETELAKKGDYVKIDYLGRLLLQNPALEVKKFIFLKLGEIYEDKGMFSEAARNFANLADLSLTFAEKIKYHSKEAELYIKEGNLEQSDYSVRKALSHGTVKEQTETKNKIRAFYITLGKEYESKNKNINAIKLYEKLLSMNLIESEKMETKRKLLALYEKSGRLKEFFEMKKTLG